MRIWRQRSPFAWLGREGATTKEIATAAGVSEALFYRHFASKEALSTGLVSHCVDADIIGSHLGADALAAELAKTFQVRAIVRSRDQARETLPTDVEIVQGSCGTCPGSALRLYPLKCRR